MLVLVSGFVLAYSLDDYPKLLKKDGKVNLQIVMGKNAPGIHPLVATDIILGLKAEGFGPGINNRIDYEVKDFSTDFILVGGPCENTVTKKFFDEDCKMGLSPGQYLIKYKEESGHSIILVFGYGEDEIRKAGDLMRNQPYQLKGNEYIGGQKAVEEQPKEIPQEQPQQPKQEEQPKEEEPPKEEAQPKPAEKKSKKVIYIGLGVLVLAIIIVWIKKKRK